MRKIKMNTIAENIFNVLKSTYDIDILDEDQRQEYIDTIENAIESDSSTIELDGMEFRLINEDAIREIYQDEQEELIKDCYFPNLKEIPWWLEIDWEKTVDNVLNSDGYGNHFSTYDGGELYTDGFYIFRTN